MPGGVVVVGGGPAGSAAAIALAAIGIRVTLLERQRYPREKPCAEFLGPGTFAEVCRLLQEPPADLAPGIEGFRVTTASGASFEGSYHGRPAGAVSRAKLDTWLARAAALAGADVVDGARVADITRAGSGWRLAVREGRHEHTVNALAVVAADGLHSTIAHRLGIRRQQRVPGRVALVAHAVLPGLTRLGEMHVRPGAYCGIAPLSGGRAGEANVALVVERGETRHFAGDTGRYLRQALTAFPGLRERADGMEVTREVLAVGPLSVASAPAPPGVFVAGDAAAFLDPFTGQGIGRALRGGTMAASAVVSWLNGDPYASRTFERRCARAFRGERAVERIVQTFLARPAVFEHAVRRLADRPTLADTLLAVTGDIAPARRVLNPAFFGRLLAPGGH